ncbi:excalibur calcium-binding domain-containing protein [Neomegalonema sp.]|uniref:excalibur calcium-binding domain-containing protein n=1 Tax=Neomegalonema sp. TaxID=2039713 RepID=UPI0026363F82|nr:excalibur calcium-binding domain-containing protein [Neomegalonema sp.]MDD2869089.1 excalibur calcium-binding domain-containing protein [Neomegalonema sp.]
MRIGAILAALLLMGGAAGEARAQAGSCKAAKSCAEAVELWCGGYSRADRDKDGVPCENLCRGKAQADEIRAGRAC